MTHTYKTYSTRNTPQSEPIPGSSQVQNSAGGFSFPVDDWTRLDRFLVLGSAAGSYYATERELTRENADVVLRLLKENGVRVVNRIAEISDTGRAAKNNPALFALAMASALGDEQTRKEAHLVLPKVARIATHLFSYVAYREQFKGWGRGLRSAIGRWYGEKAPDDLAYQMIKYQQRDGWSHADLLRLAHPAGRRFTPQHDALFRWAVDGLDGVTATEGAPASLPVLVHKFEELKRVTDPKVAARLIVDHRLPRECVPTALLASPVVWEALLQAMPMTAMIRNLASMTRVGLLAPISDATRKVVAQLGDTDRLRKARVHPIAVLSALLTYQSGKGVRGSGTWEPVAQVVDALDGAFYASFGNVMPTGKRLVLALDVSGSMYGSQVAGVPGLDAATGAAAMALITAAVEPNHTIVAFSHTMVPVSISPRQRLDDVVKTMRAIPMGGTDCALPMLWALGMESDMKFRVWHLGGYKQVRKTVVQADAFCLWTDSETWFGSIHPSQALQQYRERTGIPAKLVVVAMCANEFSIADPNDGGMLDVVGMDTATPQVISDFVGG